jgi:hypothetical protein
MGALLAALLVTPALAAPPVYPCYQTAVAPVLDGEVAGDPAWQGIPSVTGFSALGGTFAVSKQTTTWMCWDDQACYVAVVAEEPDAPKMKFSVGDGGDTWSEDGVEVFLQAGARAQVYQFAVTARGKRGVFEGGADLRKLEAAARIGADHYALEIRIPHDAMGARPQVGERWRANICRNIFTTLSPGIRFTSWAPLRQRFLEPENFGTLLLQGPAPSVAEALAATERLNAPYRNYLTDQLQASAAVRKQYLPTLQKAAGDPVWEKKASGLVTRWAEVDQTLAVAATVPLPELRRLITGMQQLAEESYNVHYKYLIAGLLGD